MRHSMKMSQVITEKRLGRVAELADAEDLKSSGE
jgi:hypothetical protein